MDDGTFGNWKHLVVAAVVLLSVLFFNRCGNKYLRMSSIVLGLCIGYALAYFLGMVDWEVAATQSLTGVNIPSPFKYGLDLNLSAFVAIGLVYLITAIEATGDITANSMISGKPIEGDAYLKRVSGGVLADGMNSLIAGMLNSFPNSIFAQNNGIIQLTGVASRYVGYYIAAMLVLLGRDGGCGGYPNHRLPTDRPEGDACFGCQSGFGAGSGADARYSGGNSGGAERYFFFRHHDRRIDRDCRQPFDTSKRR